MNGQDSPLYRLPPLDNHPRQNTPFPTLANSAFGGLTAPILPPMRFTDDTLMHVVVKVRNESERTKRQSSVDQASWTLHEHLLTLYIYRQSKFSYKLRSFKSRVLGRGKFISCSDVRVVRMPRKEYLKYFARDRNNVYIGTEREMIWTDEELELRFAKYRGAERPKWIVGRDAGRVYMVEDDDEAQWVKHSRDEKL